MDGAPGGHSRINNRRSFDSLRSLRMTIWGFCWFPIHVAIKPRHGWGTRLGMTSWESSWRLSSAGGLVEVPQHPEQKSHGECAGNHRESREVDGMQHKGSSFPAFHSAGRVDPGAPGWKALPFQEKWLTVRMECVIHKSFIRKEAGEGGMMKKARIRGVPRPGRLDTQPAARILSF